MLLSSTLISKKCILQTSILAFGYCSLYHDVIFKLHVSVYINYVRLRGPVAEKNHLITAGYDMSLVNLLIMVEQ